MKILLDTHVILWVLTDDARLSDQARKLIADPENLICYSAASVWEIAVKNQKAPEKCPYNESDILFYCQQASFEMLDMKLPHILALRTLQIKEGRTLSNYDPFDRMLIAQAKTEDYMLLSHDVNFQNYSEKCIVYI